MIKLFVSDMDGTLLGANHHISKQTADAIRRLQTETPVEFMIATGRDYTSAKALLEAHQLHAQIITLNGAALYDLSGKAQYVYEIETDITKKVLAYLNKQPLIVTLMTEHHFYVNPISHYQARLKRFYGNLDSETSDAQLIAHLEQLKPLENYNPDKEVALKWLIIADEGQEDSLKATHDFLSQFNQLDVTSSYYDNLEVTSSKAQKGLAVQAYADAHQIDLSEIITIGDSLNDRSMLALVPNSYAMANASDAIKAIAQFEAPANTDNGVAAIIEQVISQYN